MLDLSQAIRWALPQVLARLLLLEVSIAVAYAGDANEVAPNAQPVSESALPANNPPLNSRPITPPTSGQQINQAATGAAMMQASNPQLTAKSKSEAYSLNSKASGNAITQHRNNPNPNIRFQQQGGLISLDARQATWPQLLEAIEHYTGARFHYASLPVYPVSLSLNGRSAQEILTQLFGSATGYACRFSKSGLNPNTGWPQEIWVMGIITSNSQNQTLPPLPALHTSVKDLTDEQLEEAVQLHYQRELDNLIDKAKNGTPDEQNQALVELSTRPEDEANKEEMNALLKAGLHNDDPDVRGQVLYGLAGRGGDESHQLIEEALNDESPMVRASAVSAMTSGDQEDIKLLRRALNDAEPTVRRMAQSKLKDFGVTVGSD